MNENICTYVFRVLIAFGVMAIANSQYGRGYGRRRGMGRRMFPRVPIGRRFIDPYPGASIIRDPYIDPYPRGGTIIGDGIYPETGLGIIGGRRPAVISDRSRQDAQDINVSNNNVNRVVNADSGNVVVNQVTNTRTCECNTDDIMGCSGLQRCVRDSSCSGGGGNGVCRSGRGGLGGIDPFVGGLDPFVGGPVVGGPVVGGPFVGGPVVGGPVGFVEGRSDFVDSHGHDHGGVRIV